MTRMAKAPALLDLARGLAMLIVLYGHSLELFFLNRPDHQIGTAALVQYKVLASFVMPLFFLLSGCAATTLAKKNPIGVLRTSLFLGLLAYLAHALGLLGMVLNDAISGNADWASLASYALHSTLKGKDFSIIVVWFLVALAIVRLIVFALFRYLPLRIAWGTVALIGLTGFAVSLIPQVFSARSWAAGIVFFALGMALAPWLRRPVPLGLLALSPFVAALALANRGCVLDPVAACANPFAPIGPVVWLHEGMTGFLPLFYLTALLGCAVALALAEATGRVWSRWPGPVALLARIGNATLELLILNGIVLVFVQPLLKRWIPADPDPWLFVPLFLGVVGFHLVLLRYFALPLAQLQRLAYRIADRLTHALTSSGRAPSAGKSGT